jgi:hypothetical protein
MTVLDFARPYRAYDEEPDEQTMLKFIDSTTGVRLAIDYESIAAMSFKPGDVMAFFHPFRLVILEGKRLLQGRGGPLNTLLAQHRVSTIHTFCARRFVHPAPGTPVVERLIISDGPPKPEDWERWVYTQTEASA